MRRFVFLLVAAVAGYVTATARTHEGTAAPAAVAAPASFTFKARVTRVVDGDTLVVRIRRRSDRVRLIGIDAPEVGACYSSEAKTLATKLTLNRRVVLRGDPTQTRRDRFGRLLAYVQAPGGRDAGRELLRAGRAVVYVFDKPFVRLSSYQAAEAAARNAALGLWGACVAPPPVTSTTTTTTTTTATTTTATTTTATTPGTTTPTSSNCAPSYPDVCIPPPPPDLDCDDVPYRSFRVIYTVPNPDPHRFEGDRDGIGCEQ